MKESDFNLDFQNLNIESKIVVSLERIAQAFRVLLWQESKDFSLSPIMIQILIFLQNHHLKKRKVSYLADEFNMTKATISDSVRVLVQKELVRKEFDSTDNRSQILHLTAKGMEVAAKTSLFSQDIRKPIEQMNDTEKELLLLKLLDIISFLNKTGIITLQRMCLSCRYHQYKSDSKSHFCNLLMEKLEVADLRIDCPEHEEVAI
ncbi:MAG: MarR family transcriptional regulator [Saprospirales bacterium]|nr:MAG: MarR family transcriptional regulator [Saprospirales bacterium]